MKKAKKAISKPDDMRMAAKAWATKRVDNLLRMAAQANKADTELMKQSADAMLAMSRLLSSVGDEAGAVYVASLATYLASRLTK